MAMSMLRPVAPTVVPMYVKWPESKPGKLDAGFGEEVGLCIGPFFLLTGARCYSPWIEIPSRPAKR